MGDKKVTAITLLEMKRRGEKISMLTAYDYCTGLLMDQSEIDVLLVGDSLGMVVMGEETTLPVTMDDMIHHTRAVSRGVKRALLVGDMPYMSYQVSPEQAAENAGRFVKEGNAEAIKLEGGADLVPQIKAILRCGVPVMGHLGLTPQSVHQFGGFKVQGRTEEAAARLVEEAKMLEDAGVFAVLLEAVPAEVGAKVTEELTVPTIGIGAGPGCDGQVLIFHDLVGLFERFVPKFVKKYVELAPVMRDAFQQFREEVKSGKFPGPEHVYK
jgi:3-methyl-2-oxobutanoate hydroxymethyltransferase